jgi:glycosyltransferase involved in cell wall biosynthesis
LNDPAKPSVLFFVAVDWYFCLHWLPLAEAVRDAGFEVSVATEVTATQLDERIRGAGLRLLPIQLSRKGLNLSEELCSLRAIVSALRTERPDLVHAIAQKPVLYGALAARLAGTKAFVGTLAGLGYLFTSGSFKARVLRRPVIAAYRRLLAGPGRRIIVQNPEDRLKLRREAGLDSVLIRGAGVDLDRFVPAPPRKGPVIIVLASRMLWDKGVREFVDAARLLRARGVAARCVLVGTPDAGNPSAVAEAQLNDWQERGDVEWWGHRDDMPRVLAQAHVVCLPSYREGLPTILIEAAAAGLPLVATDVPGCREVVHPGVNGLLVPARDAASLAAAMATLAADETLRLRYGRQSRRLAEAEFGIGRVSLATLDLYASLIDHRPGRSGAEGS